MADRPGDQGGASRLPQCSISMTPMAEEERETGKRRAGMDFASWGCLTVVMGGGLGTGLWMACGWIRSKFGPSGQSTGRWIAVLITVVVFAAMAISFRRSEKKDQTRSKTDVESGQVQELRVRTGRVFELMGEHSSIDPALCFDLGGGRLLLLVGQWLINDYQLFGVPAGVDPESDDEITETIPNRLPAPWSFPSQSFVLRRLPESGQVLSIRVEGEFVKPEASDIVLASKGRHVLLDSMVIEGTLDDLPGVLARLPEL
jgi:hypothetical protein